MTYRSKWRLYPPSDAQQVARLLGAVGARRGLTCERGVCAIAFDVKGGSQKSETLQLGADFCSQKLGTRPSVDVLLKRKRQD